VTLSHDRRIFLLALLAVTASYFFATPTN